MQSSDSTSTQAMLTLFLYQCSLCATMHCKVYPGLTRTDTQWISKQKLMCKDLHVHVHVCMYMQKHAAEMAHQEWLEVCIQVKWVRIDHEFTNKRMKQERRKTFASETQGVEYREGMGSRCWSLLVTTSWWNIPYLQRFLSVKTLQLASTHSSVSPRHTVLGCKLVMNY